jgi:predicted DNA-binding transcriptional regulator AlpA
MSTEATPHYILLLEEVSEMTRLPRATLRFYRHRGEGGPHSFRLGNRVVYKRSDVLDWMESRYAESVR